MVVPVALEDMVKMKVSKSWGQTSRCHHSSHLYSAELYLFMKLLAVVDLTLWMVADNSKANIVSVIVVLLDVKCFNIHHHSYHLLKAHTYSYLQSTVYTINTVVDRKGNNLILHHFIHIECRNPE